MRIDLESRTVQRKFVLKNDLDGVSIYLDSMTPHKMANFSISWTTNINDAMVFDNIDKVPSRDTLDTLYGCEKARAVPILETND